MFETCLKTEQKSKVGRQFCKLMDTFECIVTGGEDKKTTATVLNCLEKCQQMLHVILNIALEQGRGINQYTLLINRLRQLSCSSNNM